MRHILTIRDALLGKWIPGGDNVSLGRDAGWHSTYFVDNLKKKQPVANSASLDEGMERRRIGRIVHDDRGNASVDWMDAPSDYKRAVLELEDQPGVLSIKKAPRTFNPYECATLPEPKKAAGPRKDLRKLSEWIKQMREFEERKRKGEVG